MEELLEAVSEHRAYLESSGLLAKHEKDGARHNILTIARQILLERVRQATSEDELNALIERIVARELDPHSAAEVLAASVLD